MQQDKNVKVWARIGAYITMPLQTVQHLHEEECELDWEGDFSPRRLYESGNLTFEGDCYIPEESFEWLTFADGETASCPFCKSELRASPISGFKWYCPGCDTHLKDFVTRKSERLEE